MLDPVFFSDRTDGVDESGRERGPDRLVAEIAERAQDIRQRETLQLHRVGAEDHQQDAADSRGGQPFAEKRHSPDRNINHGCLGEGIDYRQIAAPVGPAVQKMIKYEADCADGRHQQSMIPRPGKLFGNKRQGEAEKRA